MLVGDRPRGSLWPCSYTEFGTSKVLAMWRPASQWASAFHVHATRCRVRAVLKISPRKLAIVAKHELDEAVASRLLLFVLLLYVAGSSLACVIFLKGFQQAELQVRRALANELHVPLEEVPWDTVRQQAVPALIKLVGSEELRAVLVQMPLLAIFYTFVALSSVTLLVLATSAGTHAADLASGSARFSLVRCDRFTWTLGKFAGQAVVLLLGLLAGGVAAGIAGFRLDPQFELSTWPWLLRASLVAWVYGVCYLGIFSAFSLLTRTALQARMLSLFGLVALSILHALAGAEWITQGVPGLEQARWLFPAEYKLGLWLNSWALLVSVTLLLCMGVGAMLASTILFTRRDA